MTLLANRVRRGYYLDSVALMRVARAIAALDGVQAAALMIGTPANKALLDDSALLDTSGREAVANDLILAVRAAGASQLEAALAHAEHLLDVPREQTSGTEYARVRRRDAALTRLADANLALISIPGPFAAAEAQHALTAGLHVMIFSDNVPLADEIALKQEARARGLLMMGPDCGTCIIAGVPIAFANAVPRGSVGIVSASGTGLQEVASLLAHAGIGVAHGIGVGGRDLAAAVGGITTLMVLDAYALDPAVERIVLISKPPAPMVAQRVLERIATIGKPVVVCFLGSDEWVLPPNAVLARTLHDAARACMIDPPDAGTWVRTTVERLTPRPGRILGLYCGGTLCAEAQVVLRARGLTIASNAPIPGSLALADAAASTHCLLDLGDDEYTRGRPHPMIEPEERTARIAQALADSSLGVLLLDVVIGYGAHADPAGVVRSALARNEARRCTVVASVTGTEQDPQRYSLQVRALAEAGVVVAPSNAQAADLAARIVTN